MARNTQGARRKAQAGKADGDARERLLAAGERLFEQRPLDEVSIDDIADAAGVAHGLLFHYFKNKRSFMLAVTRRVAERVDMVHLSVAAQPTAEKAVRALLQAHSDSVSRRRASFLAASRGGSGVDGEVRAIWEESRSRSIHLLYGYLGIEQPTPQLFAAMRAWLGFFDELLVFWVRDSRFTQEQMIDASIANLKAVLANYQLLDPEGDLQIGRPLDLQDD